MTEQKSIYQDLDKVNEQEDPWATQHPYNQKAFKQLLSLIELVPHTSILEVGCAQGAFTRHLVEISKDVTGIDVSAAAIKQAKIHAKDAKFHLTTLEDFKPEKHYDVIICAEILYYIKDSKKALQKLEELGDYLVISNYIFCLPNVSFGSLRYEVALRKYPLIKRIVTTFPMPPTLTLRSVRKLRK